MKTLWLVVAVALSGCATTPRDVAFMEKRERMYADEYAKEQQRAAAKARADEIAAMAVANPFGACVMRARDSFGGCSAGTTACRNTFDADVITCASAYGRDAKTATQVVEAP